MIQIMNPEKEEKENLIIKLHQRFHDPNLQLTKKQYTNILLKIKKLQQGLNGEPVMQKQREFIIYAKEVPNDHFVYIGRTTVGGKTSKQNEYNKNYIAKTSDSNMSDFIREYGKIHTWTTIILGRTFDLKEAERLEVYWQDFYKKEGLLINDRRSHAGCVRHTTKTRMKISKNGKGKGTRAVCQLSLDGNLIRQYSSVTDASLQTETPQGNISACCRGLLRKTGGYRWTYNNLNEQQENRLLCLSMNFEINKRDGKNDTNGHIKKS